MNANGDERTVKHDDSLVRSSTTPRIPEIDPTTGSARNKGRSSLDWDRMKWYHSSGLSPYSGFLHASVAILSLEKWYSDLRTITGHGQGLIIPKIFPSYSSMGRKHLWHDDENWSFMKKALCPFKIGFERGKSMWWMNTANMIHFHTVLPYQVRSSHGSGSKVRHPGWPLNSQHQRTRALLKMFTLHQVVPFF